MKRKVEVIMNGQVGMKIQFLNGTVDIPDKPGGYTIACGCGGGKTTAISQIIWQNADSGVVYLVDTVAELEKMYQTLKTMIKKHPLRGLSCDDIFCLRSNRNEKDGMDDEYNRQLAAFKNDTSLIHNKKILLLTHVRFFSGLLPDFLFYNNNPNDACLFDGNFCHLMNRDDIRRYVLIDETPNQWVHVAKVSRMLLHAMSIDPVNGLQKRTFKEDLLKVYEEYCEGTEYDLLKGNKQFKKQKKETILKSIPYMLRDWEETPDKIFALFFLPSLLIQKEMKSHVLLFEGVGDVLLKDSKKFRLIETKGRRYNSTVRCNMFRINNERNAKFSPNTITEYINDLSDVLAHVKGKTLVVCWKDIRGLEDERRGESEFANKLQQEIDKLYKNVTIIYHGSTSTKSTNAYRVYKNIVFLGDWNIGDKDLQITCQAYDIKLTGDRWHFYYYIQTICRIGIRNHNKGKYNVFFSRDHDSDFVDLISKYFNDGIDYTTPKKKENQLNKKLKVIDERFRRAASSLASYSKEVKNAIVCDEKVEIIIPIDDMMKIQEERKEKKAKPSRFKPFVKAMSKLGVVIRIKDRRGRIK